MKPLFTKYKWMQIVYGGLLSLAGVAIIFLAYKNPENISIWLSIVCAVTLFIFGACTLFTGVFSMEERYFNPVFVYGAVSVALGVILCVNRTLIGEVITLFIACVLLTFGVICVGKASAMIYFKKPKMTVVIFFIVGTFFLVAGVLSVVFQDFVTKFIYFLAGAGFAGVGVFEIIRGFASLFAKEKADTIEGRYTISPIADAKEEAKDKTHDA